MEDTHTSIQVQPGVLWPTPTMTVTLEDAGEFNRKLAEVILNEERKILLEGKATEVAGLEQGLTAHWLEYNVLNWKYPEIALFRDYAMTGILQFLRTVRSRQVGPDEIAGISCWANVLRYGEGLDIHHHDPAYVSAHYTVQAGTDQEPRHGAADSGYTVYFRPGFLDRSHGGKASMAPSPWDEDWKIPTIPQEGRFFFFPSFVRHEVRPYFGRTQRISIAMDVFMKEQQLPIYFGGSRWFMPAQRPLSEQ